MYPKNTKNKLINSHIQYYLNDAEISGDCLLKILNEYTIKNKEVTADTLLECLESGKSVTLNNDKLYTKVIIDI